MVQKEERLINTIGSTVLLVLFFFLMLFFSNKSEQPVSPKATIEFATQTYFDNTNALQVDIVNVPTFQKVWVSFIDNINCKFYKSTNKSAFENHKIINFICSINNDYLQIKSTILERNIRFSFDRDLEFPSILS